MANKIPKTKESGFDFTSDEEARRVLLAEAKKLKSIALRVWGRYMTSYQPKQYVRTRNSQRGIKIGVVKKYDMNTWMIEVTYENDLMYHDSVIGKDQPKGHAVMLISSGWKAKNLEKKIGVREHFTRYKGFNYLGQVAKEYNAVKHKAVTLEVEWSGQYLK